MRRDIAFSVWLISYLSRVVKTLPDNSIDNDPGQEKETEQVCLHLPHLLNALTFVKDLIATNRQIVGIYPMLGLLILLPELFDRALSLINRNV